MPVAVVTSLDAPGSRRKPPTPPPVKRAAERLGVTRVLQPESVRSPEFAADIAALEADLIVVVAFKILPSSVFESARLGAFNLHGSLLPLYRGAAPIQRAVMAGDDETGLTTFALAARVDTGGILLQRRVPLSPDDTAGDLHDRLMLLGADLVVETVGLYERGEARPQPQNDARATPAPKLFREEGEIDWAQPAAHVRRHIHGFSPFPGAWTMWRGASLKLYRVAVSDDAPDELSGTSPGTLAVREYRLFVSCADRPIELIEVQQAGRKRQNASDFIRGAGIDEGERVG